MDKKSSEAVGTYRIHLGPVASSALGFYSAREYNISGLEGIADEVIEVGRSCVSPEYRTGAVVALLWQGIKELLIRTGLKYLLGCVSLETTCSATGWALHKYFVNTGKICGTLKASPVKEFELARPSEEEINKILDDKRTLLRAIPPLLKGYLRLGTKICGAPALDHEFGTIDYLILLNTEEVPERYHRHFNPVVDKEDN
jgi:putative hemolysin